MYFVTFLLLYTYETSSTLQPKFFMLATGLAEQLTRMWSFTNF